MVHSRVLGARASLAAAASLLALLLAMAAFAPPASAQPADTREGSRLSLTLEPASGDNLLGDTHEVTATVTGRRGRGLPNRWVEFTVTGETGTALPETTTVTPTTGFDVTGSDGTATFSLSSNQPETVTITACTTPYRGQAVCDSATKTFSTTALQDALNVEDAFAHLEAWQAIADANGDTRASATPGYDASGQYVIDQLEAAGYDVTTQEFEYRAYQPGPSTFERVAPEPETYTPFVDGEGDYSVLDYSGSGDVTAGVTVVDPLLPPVGGSTSGCEPEDFAGFPAGDIALVQRGTCDFGVKAVNAEAAGAVAVVIFNEGNTPARTGVLTGQMADYEVTVPVLGVSFAQGEEFIAQLDEDLTLHIATNTVISLETSFNVLADTPGGDPGNVVMLGAHLDSVPEGPGINDNGTGSAAILEVALKMAELGIDPVNKVRFAWWGAEESGLVGSTAYVNTVLVDEEGNLTEEGEAVALYLNFDMVGSPNFARFVYDGDGSGFGLEGPAGSDTIERDFEEFFAARGLASEPTEFSGRSDYAAFINVAGIPAGGLFTGAEGVKTEQQAALYGGEAGVAYDPCYHQACDTIENVNTEVFDQMLDAIGNSALIYAFSTAEVDAEE